MTDDDIVDLERQRRERDVEKEGYRLNERQVLLLCMVMDTKDGDVEKISGVRREMANIIVAYRHSGWKIVPTPLLDELLKDFPL